MTASSVAIYKSLGLHTVVAALLLISVSFSPDPLPSLPSNAPLIEATFIDAQKIADTKRAQAQAEAQARAKEAERQRKAQEAAAQKRQQALAAKLRRQNGKQKRQKRSGKKN